MPGWLMDLSPFAQWHAGAFVALGGQRGRLVAAADGAAEHVEFQLPSMQRATGVAVREVAFHRLTSVGPPSDAELCAWWNGAVRDARVKGEPLAKARRLPRARCSCASQNDAWFCFLTSPPAIFCTPSTLG